MEENTINAITEDATEKDTTVETPQHETVKTEDVDHQNASVGRSDNESPKTDTSHDNVGDAANGTPEKEKKENTRSKMAILFVLGFFAILFSCFIYAIMVGAKLSELKDTLVGVIGALSGILGFIVGYYYKSSQEQ